MSDSSRRKDDADPRANEEQLSILCITKTGGVHPISRADLREKPRRPLTSTLAFTMTRAIELIASAGNTEVPACLAIRTLGFRVSREPRGDDKESWGATKNELKFIADSPLELLGLIAMRGERGSDWQASNDEVDAFLAEFYPEREKK